LKEEHRQRLQKPSIKKDIEETNPVLIKQLNQPKLIAA
jgi:hypothetical protein